MKKPQLRKILFYLPSLILFGCGVVPSLHPLYTGPDVVFDQRLVGTWIDHNDPNLICQLTRRIDGDNKRKDYSLFVTMHDKKDGHVTTETGAFTATLLKFDDTFFLDIIPEKFPCQQENNDNCPWSLNSSFFVPAHGFIKVTFIKTGIECRMTNGDKLKKMIQEDPNAVRHEVINGTIVLTAPAEQLQQFIKDKLEDERLFPTDIRLFKKKSEKTD